MFCNLSYRECENPGGIGICGNCDVPKNFLWNVFLLVRDASDYSFKGEGEVATSLYQQGNRRIVNQIASGKIILPETSL